MKRLLLTTIAILLFVFMTACSKDEVKPDNDTANNATDTEQSGETTTESQKTVTVSILTGDVKGAILPATKVPMKDGDTALDATLKIVKEKGIQISVRGSNATAYVEGIDNLYEFDEGPLSGWEAILNGQTLDESAGVTPIKPGQKITWQYSANYMEDSEK